MYKITAPNTAYNRKLCGVQFIEGIGQTEDENTAGWFSGREGFTVTAEDSDVVKPTSKMTVDELKAYASDKDIELGDTEKKADILAKIKEVEGGE